MHNIPPTTAPMTLHPTSDRDKVLEKSKEFFGQFASKAFVNFIHMDDDQQGSPFETLMKQEYGHLLGQSGLFDQDAQKMAGSLTSLQEVSHGA